MTHIMLAFGTRPEAIKMAPIVRRLGVDDNFKVTVLVTGQHREMLGQVLDIFGIVPDIDLDVMEPGQGLAGVTSKILNAVTQALDDIKPSLVLVHGDTTTAFAVATAAFYLGIPVGHVEAGLRTYNLQSPFPEEFNRQVVGKIAKFHFAPTKLSANNLEDEGVESSAISITGNTVIDALQMTVKIFEENPAKRQSVIRTLNEMIGFDWQKEKFILVTGHRRENFGRGFDEICRAIADVAKKRPNIKVVYPVHLNPKVRGPVWELLAKIENVFLIDPLGYECFVMLLKHCYLVLTDSGGIQEEAPSFGRPVLVMRDTTERPEAVDAGTVRLVGASFKSIRDGVSELLDNEEVYQSMSKAHNPYGDGQASDRIAWFIKQNLSRDYFTS